MYVKSLNPNKILIMVISQRGLYERTVAKYGTEAATNMGVPTSEIRLLKLGADEETIFRSIFVPKTLKEK